VLLGLLGDDSEYVLGSGYVLCVVELRLHVLQEQVGGLGVLGWRGG
jgi:hypothetical protein